MKKLGKLNLMKEKILSHEELVSFRGGSSVSRDEYCATNCSISQYCWSIGDSTCHYNAGVAWMEHCDPYGYSC